MELAVNYSNGGSALAERHYRATEISQLFKVSRAAVNKWLKADLFPNAYQTQPGNIWLIPGEDVEAHRQRMLKELEAEVNKLKEMSVAQ